MLLAEPARHYDQVDALLPSYFSRIRAQVIEKLFRERWNQYDGLGALILTPTRELALQIFDELRKVCLAVCLLNAKLCSQLTLASCHCSDIQCRL